MEPRTLEELYRRYAGELYLYAYSLCQNEAQAQDLTAEAFCRALLALDGADAGWRSWLYKGNSEQINHLKLQGGNCG